MTAIATPCQKVCSLDPATDLCRGCGRSLTEIAGWRAMTNRQRTAVMIDLPHRPGRIANGQMRDRLG